MDELFVMDENSIPDLHLLNNDLCASWYGGVIVVLLVCLMVWWCYSGVTCVPHGMVVL